MWKRFIFIYQHWYRAIYEIFAFIVIFSNIVPQTMSVVDACVVAATPRPIGIVIDLTMFGYIKHPKTKSSL